MERLICRVGLGFSVRVGCDVTAPGLAGGAVSGGQPGRGRAGRVSTYLGVPGPAVPGKARTAVFFSRGYGTAYSLVWSRGCGWVHLGRRVM